MPLDRHSVYHIDEMDIEDEEGVGTYRTGGHIAIAKLRGNPETVCIPFPHEPYTLRESRNDTGKGETGATAPLI